MGTPLFSVPILKSLHQNNYPISIVYTQPPRKSERGQKINKSPIQNIAEKLDIDLLLKYKLIKKKEDFYIINEKFKCKSETFSLFSSKQKKQKKKNETIYDHHLLIESAIVKIMKRHEKCAKSDLFNEVESFLKKKS